ncbi:MAG: magnesium chelatase [Dehalococcoidia bacterium]|nr:magnesium chelatase [Dehalococcoidia bacterium]
MAQPHPKTLGELTRSGYKPLTVKQELRKNLIARMQREEPLFPGIVGYEDTVIPQMEHAILAGHDVILLGERGQAKTRLIRALVGLLDEHIPYVEGSEVVDNPYHPISLYGRQQVEKLGDRTPIAWMPRDLRYGEKLATPDITMADLIGEIDPIKVAEGRYLSDELTIHYGLIPRTNRGIFCINELPDLTERIQVGLFNLLEERDIQIKGYRLRLPLDVAIVASANPEDYTNRGRIITPLKDRYGSVIRTHYPKNIKHEMAIVAQEAHPAADVGVEVFVPEYMKEVVAEITAMARRSPDVNQRSGVSVRVTIANYETMNASAVRRALRLREPLAVPRITDLAALVASTTGKIELEGMEEGREGRILEELVKKAVLTVHGRYVNLAELEPLIARFDQGMVIEASEAMPSAAYAAALGEAAEFRAALRHMKAREDAPSLASAMEFIMEGLHLNRRINRDRVEGALRYRG